MKYLLLSVIFIVNLSGSTVAGGNTYESQVDENISNPPSQEMLTEMKLRANYMKVQQNLINVIAAYFYAKGWRQGWDGCARQKHAQTGVSSDEREKQLGRKLK